MAESRLSADYVSYLDAAAAILSRHGGHDAVAAFGLPDALAGGGARDLAPVYAFLEAEGRTCASTPALGLLALASCAVPASASDGNTGFGIPFGRGSLAAVTGMDPSSRVIVDRSGSGLVVLPDSATVRRPGPSADGYLRVVDGAARATSVLLPDSAMTAVRETLRARVQLGVAAALLGICDRLLGDAIAYAKTRRQFGESIGSFQAVQHLLAWASTDVHQLRCMVDIAVLKSGTALDPELSRTTKAMAGRTLHSVAQAATQVTGAISFTWEYSLNQLHQRGLALDQMAGPSADLVAEIGRSVRTTGSVPSLVEVGDLTGA